MTTRTTHETTYEGQAILTSLPKYTTLATALHLLLLLFLLPALAGSPAAAEQTPAAGSDPDAGREPAGDRPPTDLERRMTELGLVDVRSLDPAIACELKYTTAANFMGRDVYGDVDQCFLLEDAARRLAAASARLREHFPDLHLVVGDALRPRAVQRRMWRIVEGTPQQPYVADPSRGSMHNYGAAVDITLADSAGNRLDMGTPMDHFGPETQVALEAHYHKRGELSDEQLANRLILREVMTRAGFIQLPIEWWHYDAWDTGYVRRTFSLIETFGAEPRKAP